MKFPPFYAALISVGLMAAPAHLFGQAAPPAVTNMSGPRMTFDSKDYHFGKVTAGTLVKHVFIVTNTGDQPLQIFNVAPGCHCTTAGDFTHQVAPGKTGEIPIQFDSGSFRGSVTKAILVTSNDKLAPRQSISLQGTIWRLIDYSPQFAYMTLMPDASNATTVVHISSQSDEPLTLSEPTSANGSFKAELKTIKPGKEFDLTITALPPLAPGNTSGSIFVRTSFTNMPMLNITTMAMMQPMVGVVPMQIFLPTQIHVWLTNRVTITANGKKSLALSDPEISDKRASVKLTTLVPGRSFQLVTAFPPGFEVATNEQAQVTVKSDNASSPVITVPITQYTHKSMPPPPTHPKVMSQNPPLPPATGHP